MGAIGNTVLAELKRIGVEIVFLSSGAVCGFPPCPHIGYLRSLIEKVFGMNRTDPYLFFVLEILLPEILVLQILLFPIITESFLEEF